MGKQEIIIMIIMIIMSWITSDNDWHRLCHHDIMMMLATGGFGNDEIC